MKAAITFLSGVLFASGLSLSGMTLPSKVTAFLDVSGDWDPSLALVMGGALLVLFLAKRVTPSKPLLEPGFETPPRAGVDAPLLVGASLFGAGWGLSGFCPGPALVSLSAGARSALWFVPAMVAGMLVERVVTRRKQATAAPACG